MVDVSVISALREALKQNEIGNASPYVLSYAKLGSSGASFGIFQADTNVDEDAQKTLRQVLTAAGAAADVCDRIVSAVSQPCPDGSPLSRADQKLTDKALSSDAGRPLVDAMDDRTLIVVTGEMDTSLAAAQARNFVIDGAAQLCIGLWVNMTGAPRTLNSWIAGGTIGGVTPPAGPSVSQADLLRYLGATKFFTLHPKNLIHFKQSVAAGAALLPAPAAAAQLLAMDVRATGFVDLVLATAAAQWDFFGKQAYDIAGHPTVLGHKEGEDGFFQRIGEYWLFGTGTHGVNGLNHDMPWSAAFISWVMKTSGAGDRFRYSTQHSVYIFQAIRDLMRKRDAAGYWAWRLPEQKPQTGDIVCWSRQGGIDYDHQNGGNYKGHCDIVVEVQDARVYVIGGNVGDSVTRRPLPLNDQGFLLPTQQGSETLFALMTCRIS